MSDASLIQWEQFNIAEGRTLNFDFLAGVANKTVVNFTTGSGRNSIDGTLLSNGRVVLVTPGQRLDLAGAIQAEGFLASTIPADDLNALLTGQSTGFGSTGGAGRLLRVEPGASLRAASGEVVLAGSVVSISGGAVIDAPLGAVRTVAAQAFNLSTTGVERVAITATGTANTVVTNGEVQGGDVEMKASTEISNGGLIQTTGGVGRVFLRVGPGGKVINSGTGMINGILQVTGEFDDVGTSIDPDNGDAATTVKSAVSRFPALRRPGEKPGKETVVVDTGGVAASVDNSRERTKRRTQRVAANRSALHRKSSFFGLRGGATKKKE
jgi:filamentous hemagglutinin family protein